MAEVELRGGPLDGLRIFVADGSRGVRFPTIGPGELRCHHADDPDFRTVVEGLRIVTYRRDPGAGGWREVPAFGWAVYERPEGGGDAWPYAGDEAAG